MRITPLIDEYPWSLQSQQPQWPAINELRRERNVFFVGGILPINETLETMFESYCMESTSLFHLTFGPTDSMQHGIELGRQIKRNFHARLMGRLEHPADAKIIEELYAAGIDLLDIPLPDNHAKQNGNDFFPEQQLWESLRSAVSIFPRWGVASTLTLGAWEPTAVRQAIDALLTAGIVPLLFIGNRAALLGTAEEQAQKEYLTAAWQRHNVSLSNYLPLLNVMAGDLCPNTNGKIRGIFDRLRNQQRLVAADLRRHLRVQPTENSLDSAGL